MYNYTQMVGGEETWQAVPVAMLPSVLAKKPRFTTVLSVSQLVEVLANEDRDKLKYQGPFYLDWDGDLDLTTEKCATLLASLQDKGLNLQACRLYATGGRGYHCEIPLECFMPKVPKGGIAHLPVIFKYMALDIAVDTLDLRVYSGGRGRMWRTPNVERENGRFKVPIHYHELLEMTPERYVEITSKPRELWPLDPPTQAVGLTLIYDKAVQEVSAKLAKRKKKGNEAGILKGRSLPSLQAMMEGRGIKGDTGFHQLSMQLGIIADGLGWDEDRLAQECEGLIQSHSGDGTRYNTPEKRRFELVRMHRFMADNPCYEFSVGAVKVLLTHDAPDLDGVPASREQIDEDIEKAATRVINPDGEALAKEILGEYEDVGITVELTKYGVYVDTEHGKKRICAMSFDNIHILRDVGTNQVSCYEADILINGRFVGRQTIELDIFSGLQAFNRFCSRHAHALQGQDHHVRGLMMSIAKKGAEEGKVMYVAKREGLDVINIPGHENEQLREPFMVWSDSRGVLMQPRARETGVQMSFQGFPDPRGNYRTDIADAPRLVEWIQDEANQETLKTALHSFFTCQRPDVIGNMVGWNTACFYRMLFHKAFDKFPLMHVNGAAGAGKTEMNLKMLSLNYFRQEPKQLTPESTLFAIQQHLASSASIPLMIDEYKPHEMGYELHNKLKLLFRDAYNNREVMRGGGTRESDDYRMLHSTQLSAPILFIGEVMEEEPAVMERVVLVTVVRPPSAVAMKWSARFNVFKRSCHVMAILGQYLAASIVNDYSVKQLIDEFSPMYDAAKDKYLLTEADMTAGLPEEVLRAKQGAKERTVYNFTVSKFGLLKMKALLAEIFGPEEFAEEFAAMEDAIYSRMADLLPATQAEYLRVLNTMAHMSYGDREHDSMSVLQKGRDYEFLSFGGKDAIEFSMRTAYGRYRIHQKNVGYKPLFSGDMAFLHAMKDSPALLAHGPGQVLEVAGGSYIFDLDELRKLGVDEFKSS
jgi:hypothetical protein